MVSNLHIKAVGKIFIINIRCFFNSSINKLNFIRIDCITCINIKC